MWDLLCHASIGMCVFLKSRHLRQTVTFTASYTSEQPVLVSACDDAGWPVCAAVNSDGLKEFWPAACSLTVWHKVLALGRCETRKSQVRLS